MSTMETMTTPKVFNDPIHGTVELHPLLFKIIDTPQFQRLRYLKQLGGAYFVYPGASHNRFEHSIGAAHLAGELVKALRTRQPDLNIDPRDVLCVQIAGLCHDLGHGPFSHSFEKFIHKARPEKKDWKHEKASLDMFDHLVDVNELEPVMEKHGLVLPEDQIFIKEQIGGLPDTEEAGDQKWPYEGRPEDKSFLYEIVANKRNGIDVDKFDYLARDAHHLGIQTNFNYRRFIKFARVCDVDGLKQICTRDKEVNNLYELYHLRYNLHKNACHHSVNNIIESLITKAFLKADKHIKIQGSKGKMFTLSTAINDMEAYTKLTDHVYERILNSSDLIYASRGPSASEGPSARECRSMAEAKDILKKVVAREHPRFLGERTFTEAMNTELEKMKSEDKEEMKRRQDDKLKAKDSEVHKCKHRQEEDSAGCKYCKLTAEPEDFKVDKLKRRWEKELASCQDDELKAENFEVHIVELNYGMKNKNPIDEMRFYNKRNPDEAFELPEDQKSMFHPTIFSEKLIRVYYKKTDEESLTEAYRHMVLWWKNQGPNPQ